MDLQIWEHFVAGLFRISIGVFAGIVVGLAVHSGLINNTLVNDETGDSIIFLLCFIGGFSESLVPSLLRSGEGKLAPLNGASATTHGSPRQPT
jgi:hypothetical protein